MKTMFKSSLFWILLSLISIGSIGLSFYLFPRAFSIINIDIQMDRLQALNKASLLAKNHAIGPEGYSSATSFSTDDLVQTYAEIKSKNKDAFTAMIEENLYAPYTWHVRHFKEFEPHEATFYFTPAGELYGFYESLSEKTEGAALTSEQARTIAEKETAHLIAINFDDYLLVEASQETQPSKRIDHAFVYERVDKKLIDAPYRLRLVVSGDKLTQIVHSVKVPDTFIRTYQEMRSTNSTIASAANMGMMILYFIGCALIGLFYFVQRKELLWHNPLLWGILLSLLQVFAYLNKFPLLWMYYSTASSKDQFIMNIILGLLQSLSRNTFVYSFIILAGESLTRKAFGHHIQFWKLWSYEPAHSKQVLGRTVVGYLLPPLYLVYVMSVYILAERLLGWWSPSSTLTNPNILACYFPWLESVVQAFNAGFTEEFIFRALPLATAALLGMKFGKKYLWIAAAFILQIIIFGAAHANYPTQPAYARVIELIVPSTIFGSLYLFFGLLPAILSHFIFDVILMSLPIFSFHGAGSFVNKLLVILLSSIPLFIVCFSWLRSKKGFITLPEYYYNYTWHIPSTTQKLPTQFKIRQPVTLSAHRSITIFALGLLGALAWCISTPFVQEAPALTISRTDAITQATKILKEKGIELTDQWHALTRVDGTFQDSSYEQNQHTFIWQNGGSALYRNLLQSFYLHPPFWLVRFVRFTGTVSERSQEYHVSLTGDGTLLRFSFIIPEDTAMTSVNKEQAQAIATDYLKNELHHDLATVKEIKAITEKLPNRADWLFTFADETITIPEHGQARIDVKVSGNTVTDSGRYIHIPEQWKRDQKLHDGRLNIIKQLCLLFFTIFIVTSLIIAIINFGNKFSFWWAGAVCSILFALYVANLVNLWPHIISNFNTSQPFKDQVFRIFGSSLTQFFIRAGMLGMFIVFITNLNRIYKPLQDHFKKTCIIGISIGLFMIGCNSIALFYLQKTMLPDWATFTPLNGIIPLGTIASTLISYLIITLLFILFIVITNYAHYIKQWSYRVIAPLFVTAFVSAYGATYIVSISSWLLAGTILGSAFFLIYYLVWRYDYSSVPIAIALYISSNFIQQAIFNAYPAAPLVGILGVLVMSIVGLYWSYKMSSASLIK